MNESVMERQMRQNVRNAFLTASVDQLRDEIAYREPLFRKQPRPAEHAAIDELKKMLTECAEANVHYYGELPLDKGGLGAEY